MLPPMTERPPPLTSSRIRVLAVAAHRPQTQLAGDVGLSWPQWQRRMRGDVAWRLDEVQNIARALGVPLEGLTGEQDEE
jgi:DNA-binding phage protein